MRPARIPSNRTCNGRGQYNTSTSNFFKLGYRCLYTEKCTFQISSHYFVPLAGIHIDHFRLWEGAGICTHHVQTAKCVGRCIYQVLHRIPVRNITLTVFGGTPRCAQFFHGRITIALASRTDHHLGALRSKHLSNPLTNAFRASCNDDGAIFNRSKHSIFSGK